MPLIKKAKLAQFKFELVVLVSCGHGYILL